MNHPDISAY